MTSFLELRSPTPLSKDPEKNKGMTGLWARMVKTKERVQRVELLWPGAADHRCWPTPLGARSMKCTATAVLGSRSHYIRREERVKCRGREMALTDGCEVSDLVIGTVSSLGSRFGREQVCSGVKY